MKTEWTEQSRREWIQRRQKESAVWRLIHMLGSLRLAMLLLFTIAVACAVATFYESSFNAKVAQAYVYKAPWFVLWLAVLCINLLAVTLTRWPWQRKHAGFIITHYGIIVLLVGAVIGQKFGFEASVNLHAGEKPENRLVINETILQIDDPAEGASYLLPFRVDVRAPSPERPRRLPMPVGGMKLVVDDYTEKLATRQVLIAAPDEKGVPAVDLRFTSGMMSQSVPMLLAIEPAPQRTNEFFGRADIILVDEIGAEVATAPAGKESTAHVHETQVVLARAPDAPVVHAEGDVPSAYTLRLLMKEGVPFLAVRSASDRAAEFPVSEVLAKPVKLPGELVSLTVQRYWPHFEMQNGQPVSVSDKPENPAVLVTLEGDVPKPGKPTLELAVTAPGTVSYRISRGGAVSKEGTLAEGESAPLGWADWALTVERAMSKAVVDSILEPQPAGATGEALPGIRARLQDESGKDGETQWIPSGRAQTLYAGGEWVRVAFGLRTHRLPFMFQLQKFEVPRDEGTETPADYISTVRFSERENASAEPQVSTIRMNHPASYPPGLWRAALGLNYKFSQASWNPEDLNETTLQVLHDPGWPLKWIGSSMICIGIFILFYLKPTATRKKPAREPVSVS